MIRTRGDTIIELMLAFSIFSLAAVGTIVIMNKGIAVSQQSLEASLVRVEMDGQAEAIRYLRDTADPLWDTVVGYQTDHVAPLAPSQCPSATDIQSMQGFFIGQTGTTINVYSVNAGNFSPSITYARRDSSTHSSGLWVQIARAEGSSTVVAYDIYIHACWDSLVSSVPATLGTIVRIYDK
jgi:type II secretory pathway pseudopilin PulG